MYDFRWRATIDHTFFEEHTENMVKKKGWKERAAVSRVLWRFKRKALPVNYTLVSNNFVLAPRPVSDPTVINMTYYKIPQVLSDTNPSNEYLEVCPDLLLYAALVESAPFLMNDERLITWEQLYTRGLTSITKSDEQSEFPAQPLAVQIT